MNSEPTPVARSRAQRSSDSRARILDAAVACLIDRSLIQTRVACVDVELRGSLTRAKAVSWLPDDSLVRVGINLPEIRPIEIVSDVDNDRLVELLLERLAYSTPQEVKPSP